MNAEREVTIRMPKELLAKWLAALRSGEYQQGRGSLCDESAVGHCCLGVLQRCTGPDVERYADGDPRGLPTREWLAAHSVEFSRGDGAYDADSPDLPALEALADSANDSANDSGFSFAEIADAIEACAEGV